MIILAFKKTEIIRCCILQCYPSLLFLPREVMNSSVIQSGSLDLGAGGKTSDCLKEFQGTLASVRSSMRVAFGVHPDSWP